MTMFKIFRNDYSPERLSFGGQLLCCLQFLQSGNLPGENRLSHEQATENGVASILNGRDRSGAVFHALKESFQSQVTAFHLAIGGYLAVWFLFRSFLGQPFVLAVIDHAGIEINPAAPAAGPRRPPWCLLIPENVCDS
jgi:hypothetical protein